MDKEKLIEYINFFNEKAEKNKVIIFVGSGVSRNVEGMPSWYDLIQKMAQSINYSKCSYCQHKKENCRDTCLFMEEYSTDEFLKIPQYVYNKDKELYNKILKDNIQDITIDAPLSNVIFDINPLHIITTNYDTLLESSQNEFREQYDVIVTDKDLLNTEKNKYIIKMHGNLSQLETIILKEQDYLEYSQKHMLTELFIKSLLTNHTILFLGYSLSDYNVKLIISWLNYMRLQNDALNDNQKVGYILLDEEQIDITQTSYFAGVNIEVVNINKMPYVDDIPKSLTNEKGKRLYSFLRAITNPLYIKDLAFIKNSIRLLEQYTFVDYHQILKTLYIQRYTKKEKEICLVNKNDYDLLEQLLNGSDSRKLKKLFINAGITLVTIQWNIKGPITLGNISDNFLFQDNLFKLYIQNKYYEIKQLLKTYDIDLNKKYFYQHIIDDYHNIPSNYYQTDFSKLTMEQKVAYLYNISILNYYKGHSTFDPTKVKYFIKNITSSKERELFSLYTEIYNGNSQKLLYMNEKLKQLKENVIAKNRISSTGPYSELYEIKNAVMIEYFFYYFNNIFCKTSGYELNTFFKPYIEAIICTNTERAEEPTIFCGEIYTNKKYSIDYIDLDIITKFISTKDLYNLLTKYHIKKLNICDKVVTFLVNCFINLSESLVKGQTYGFMRSSFLTLSNIILLLQFVDLNEKHKKIVEKSVKLLFCDEKFSQCFFSQIYPDFKYALYIFSMLCKSLSLSIDIQVIEKIINENNFFEYMEFVNLDDLRNLRNLITSMLDKNNIATLQGEIKNIIEATDSFSNKISLLRLFLNCIIDEDIKNNYIKFLSSHFSELDIEDIYDFASNNWLKPLQTEITKFLSEILELQKKQDIEQYYPNPLEMRLECIYLLYITDIIKDISMLKDLAKEKEHLQFLLNPDTFNYTKVDFSNYMWVNFIKYSKLIEKFIEHKEEMIPLLKTRIRNNTATDDEKKILYGYFLEKDEIWNIY